MRVAAIWRMTCGAGRRTSRSGGACLRDRTPAALGKRSPALALTGTAAVASLVILVMALGMFGRNQALGRCWRGTVGGRSEPGESRRGAGNTGCQSVREAANQTREAQETTLYLNRIAWLSGGGLPTNPAAVWTS